MDLERKVKDRKLTLDWFCLILGLISLILVVASRLAINFHIINVNSIAFDCIVAPVTILCYIVGFLAFGEKKTKEGKVVGLQHNRSVIILGFILALFGLFSLVRILELGFVFFMMGLNMVAAPESPVGF